MTTNMGRSLGIFQNVVARRITGKHPKQQLDESWDYPPLETEMEGAAFVYGSIYPEEAECGSTVRPEETKFGPLQGDGAEVWWLGC